MQILIAAAVPHNRGVDRLYTTDVSLCHCVPVSLDVCAAVSHSMFDLRRCPAVQRLWLRSRRLLQPERSAKLQVPNNLQRSRSFPLRPCCKPCCRLSCTHAIDLLDHQLSHVALYPAQSLAVDLGVCLHRIPALTQPPMCACSCRAHRQRAGGNCAGRCHPARGSPRLRPRRDGTPLCPSLPTD